MRLDPREQVMWGFWAFLYFFIFGVGGGGCINTQMFDDVILFYKKNQLIYPFSLLT